MEWIELEKSENSVLLEAIHQRKKSCPYLVSSLGNGKGTADFSSTSTIDNTVVTDKVSNGADGIVKRALGFIDDL